MRVIAGEFRSRKLKSLPGENVRPTPDRLRESLFNIIAPRLDGKVFLDAYAGTGAVAIEALSRGAARAILFETNRGALEIIEDNLKSLQLVPPRATVSRGKATSLLPRHTADIVFVDPPYDRPKEYGEIMELLGERERPPELVIVQHSPRQRIAERYGPLAVSRTVRQGDNILTFFAPAERTAETP